MEKEYRLMTLSIRNGNKNIGERTKDLKNLQALAKHYVVKKHKVEILEVVEDY